MTEALLHTVQQWFPVFYLLALGLIALLWLLLVLLILLNMVHKLGEHPEQEHPQRGRFPAARRSRRYTQHGDPSSQRRDWQKHVPSYISFN